MISEETKKMIENSFCNDFVFTKNKIINIQSVKRSIHSYFVNRN